MGKVYSGQPITRSAISAADWNAARDAAAWSAQRQLNNHTARPKARLSDNGVLISNGATSPGPLPRFWSCGLDTVGITEAVNADAFQNRQFFRGVAITRAHYGRYAVAHETIPENGCGVGVVSGLTQAYIYIVHEDHDRADAHNVGGNYLRSAFYGSAEILYKPPGTGLKLCTVRIGSWVAPVRRAVAGGDIAAGSSGTVTICKGTGPGDTTASEQVTAGLEWMAGTTGVSAGDELEIQFYPYPDLDRWVIVGAESHAYI